MRKYGKELQMDRARLMGGGGEEQQENESTGRGRFQPPMTSREAADGRWQVAVEIGPVNWRVHVRDRSWNVEEEEGKGRDGSEER